MAEKKYTRIVVEENNEHGFDSYRVPGIVTASNMITLSIIRLFYVVSKIVQTESRNKF